MERDTPQGLPVDALPESYPYRDDGCSLFPSCLSCPLPQCKHDDPGWLQRQVRGRRDRQIRRARHDEGLSARQLARRFDVSLRTVFRALSGDSGREQERALAPGLARGGAEVREEAGGRGAAAAPGGAPWLT